MSNYNYYYDEYYYDVATLAQRYKKITYPHIEGFIRPDKIFYDENNCNYSAGT